MPLSASTSLIIWPGLDVCTARRIPRHSAASRLSLSLVVLLFLRLANSQSPPPNYSYNQLPDTSFSCRGKAVGGYYADVEAHCQMFHVCGSSQLTSFRFLCPNNTVFDQQHLICANWHQVRCDNAAVHYARNFEIFKTTVGDRNNFQSFSDNSLQDVNYDDYDTRLSGSSIESRSIGARDRVTSSSSKNRISDATLNSANSLSSRFDERDQFGQTSSRASPFTPVQSVPSSFSPARQNTVFNRGQSFEQPKAVSGEFASSPSTARPNFASQQDSPRAAVFNRLEVEPIEKVRPETISNLPVQNQRSVENFKVEPINSRPAQSKPVISSLPVGSPSKQQRAQAAFGVFTPEQEVNPSAGNFFSSTVVPASDLDNKIMFHRQDFIRRRKLQLNKNSELNNNQVHPESPTFPSINRGFSATVPTRSTTTPSTVFAEPSPSFGVDSAQNQLRNSIDTGQIAGPISVPKFSNKPVNTKQPKVKPIKSRSRNRGSRKFNPNLPGGHLKSFEFRKINRVTPIKTKKPVFKAANKKRKILNNSLGEENFSNRNRINNSKKTNNVVFIPATQPPSANLQSNNFPPTPRQTTQPDVIPILPSQNIKIDPKKFGETPKHEQKNSNNKNERRKESSGPEGEIFVTPWRAIAKNEPSKPQGELLVSQWRPIAKNDTKNELSSNDVSTPNLINEIFPNSNTFLVQTRPNQLKKSEKPVRHENKANTSKLVTPFTTTTTSAPLIIRKRIKIFSKPRRRFNQTQTLRKPNIKRPVITRKRITLANKKTRKIIERPRFQPAEDKKSQQQQQQPQHRQQQRARTRVISTPRRRATLRPAFLRRATRIRQRTTTTTPPSSTAITAVPTTPSPSRKPPTVTRSPRRRQSPASIYRSSVSLFTRTTTATVPDNAGRAGGTHSPTAAPPPESTATTPAPIVHVSTLPTNKEAPGLGRQSGFFVRPKLQLSSAVNSLAQRRDKITSLVGLARPAAFDHDNALDRAHRSTPPAPTALSSLSEQWTPVSAPWQSGTGDSSQLSSLLFDSSSPGQLQRTEQPEADYDYEYYDTAAASLEHLAKLARVNSQFKTLSKYRFI